MPIIIPFDTGWTIISRLIDKLIYSILLLLWVFQNIVLPRLHSSKDYVCNIVLPYFIDWNYTPILRKNKNRDKTSHGAGKFSMKLHNSKKSSYNERNCKSERHNRRHSLLRHKPSKTRWNANTTSLPDLNVKTRSVKGTKYPSPRRRDRMTWVLHRRQVREQLHLSNLDQHILPYDEPDLYNDFITKDTSQPSRFIINFPRHCVLGHVLSDSDPLDDLGPWKEVVRPTKKPRSVGPHKSKPKETTSMKKTRQKNKKSRSVKVEVSKPEESRQGDDPLTPQRLASVAGNLSCWMI